MKNSENKINDNINLDILKRLNYIYRATVSANKTLDYSKKINQLINRYKSKNISSNVNETWSEKTVLMITYADSVNNGLIGNTLSDFILFYNKYFFKFIDTIHFLPFFPSSGDGGFAVKNHEEIDPVFGDWEQIKELSKYTNIMTDLVLNHASSEGKWFKNFISGKSPGKDYFFTIDKLSNNACL